MLKIKLLRKGKKNQAHFRVVVTDARRARDSKFIADLGYLNPHTNPADFHIDENLAKEWLSKGAQPTETVSHYFYKLKLIKSIHKGSTTPAKKPKKKAKPEEPAQPAATPAQPAATPTQPTATPAQEESKVESTQPEAKVEPVQTEQSTAPAEEVKTETTPAETPKPEEATVATPAPAEEAPVEEKKEETGETATEEKPQN